MNITTQHKLSLTIGLICFLFYQPVQTQALEVESYRGDVFDLSGKSKQYTLTHTVKADDKHLISRVVYRDLADNIALIEEIDSVNNDIKTYTVIQKQTNKKATVTQTKDKIKFLLEKISDGSTIKSSEQDRPSRQLAVGSSIFSLVHNNWNRLQQGKDVDFVIALWDRQDTINFYLRQVSIEKNIMLLKMLPSNFFIRQFVDAIEIKFDINTKEIISYKGRTNLMKSVDGSWEEFDGFIAIQTVPPKRALSTKKSVSNSNNEQLKREPTE